MNSVPRACCSFIPEVLIDHMRDLAPKLLDSKNISREYHEKVMKFCGAAARGLEESNHGRRIRDARRDAFAPNQSRGVPLNLTNVRIIYPVAATPTVSSQSNAPAQPSFYLPPVRYVSPPQVQVVSSQTQATSSNPVRAVPVTYTLPAAHYFYPAQREASPYPLRAVPIVQDVDQAPVRVVTSLTKEATPAPVRALPAYVQPLPHYIFRPTDQVVTSQTADAKAPSPLRGVTVIYAQPVVHYVTQPAATTAVTSSDKKEVLPETTSPTPATIAQSSPFRGFPQQPWYPQGQQPWYPQGPYQQPWYPQGQQQPWPYPQGPYGQQQPWPYPQGPYQFPSAPAPAPAPAPKPAPAQTAPGEKPVIRVFDCTDTTDTDDAREIDISNPPPALQKKVNNVVTTLTYLHQANYELYGRNGFDNKGSAYKNYLNYDQNMFNAFWDGSEMVYGDPKDHYGDDGKPADMTDKSVVRHEQGHSMNSYKYEGASGAWEEFKADWNHFILEHKEKGITKPADAPEEEWMLGDALIPDDSKGKECMRRVDKPGSASQFDVQYLALIDGKPNVQAFVNNAQNPTVVGDHGGVHIYSAIPSYVFYKTAIQLNEPIYDRQAKLLYAVCSDPKAKRDAGWQELADAWVAKARELGYNDIADALTKNWADAGVTISQPQQFAAARGFASYPTYPYTFYPNVFHPQVQQQQHVQFVKV